MHSHPVFSKSVFFGFGDGASVLFVEMKFALVILFPTPTNCRLGSMRHRGSKEASLRCM